MELVEGQVVTFILRTQPEANKEVVQTKPTKEQAEALGLPLEMLLQGASKLRAKDDPIITPVSYYPDP
jgi:hypothetical protein